jgi:hypothetical protein
MDYVGKRLDFLLKISNLHQNYSQSNNNCLKR